jgi:membrane protein
VAEQPKRIVEASGSEIRKAVETARPHRKAIRELKWHDLQALFSEGFDSWSKHKAPRLGASLAFYTLLSLAPLLLVVVAVVGLVFGHTAAQRAIVQQVQALIGDQGAKAAQALLEGSSNKTHGLIATIIGVITLLFGASGVMIELRDALNTIWEVPTPQISGFTGKIRAYVKERLLSFAIVLSIGFLLIVSLALSTWISAVGAVSAAVLPANEAVLHVVNALVSFAIITGLFASMYKVMPDVRLEWSDVLLGGAFTSLLFTVGKLLLGLYLGKASIASSYGAFASIVVLVVWVYYSGQIFFLGAELTRAYANRHGSLPSLMPEPIVKSASEASKPRAGEEPTIILPPS